MRVLLVEPDMTSARGATQLLKSIDAVVDTVDTGEEALEMARHYDYDIVILDLLLPDMDGFDVVRRLRGARIETPVMVLSGLQGPQARVKALGLGADDFVTKPFDRDEVLARIKAVVRRN